MMRLRCRLRLGQREWISGESELSRPPQDPEQYESKTRASTRVQVLVLLFNEIHYFSGMRSPLDGSERM
jgi:hypothetical protein